MIEGDRLRLRPWREDDLSALTALRNDLATQAQLLARARGSDPVQLRDWLHARTSLAGRLFFVIADRLSDECSGYLQLDELDFVDRRAELGICLGVEMRGRGLGSEAIALVLRHLVRNWNLRKVHLRVRADNALARACYRKLGFQECGRLRAHVYLEGAWHDVVMMELLMNEGVEA